MSVNAQRGGPSRQPIVLLLGHLVVIGRRYVLLVLDGALMEAHDGARRELLRELARLGSVVEAFADLVGAEVWQWVLLRLLAEVFAFDERVVDFGGAGARLDRLSQRCHFLVTDSWRLLRLMSCFICVKGALFRLARDAKEELCLLRDFVSVGRREVLALSLVHLVIREQRTVTGLENALFRMAIKIAVTRRFSPVFVRRVLLRAKFDFFSSDKWVQEACLLWHLLPEDDALLEVGICRRVVKL